MPLPSLLSSAKPPLSRKQTILLLAMLTAFPPVSTDMYLPALPLLAARWGLSQAAMNSTLVCWFATYCLCLLLYGPISDRVGRKGPLLIGVGVFVAGSLGCALSNGLPLLLGARIVQAAGAAASTVMALAIAKDVFEVSERAKVLGYIGVINGLAPMLAPTLGGWTMMLLDWRWVFIVQSLLAGSVLVLMRRLPETLAEPTQVKASAVFLSYLHLMRLWRFSLLNLAMALPVLAMFAFIAASPGIYISGFGLSEAAFGYFFGFNALAMMIGSYGFSRLERWLGAHRVLQASFVAMALGGAVLMALSHAGPWAVAMPMWLVSLGIGLSRPPSFNLVLEQVSSHTGSASSLISFATMMSGAVAMSFISLDWSDKASVIGGLALGGSLLALGTVLAMGQGRPEAAPRA